MSMTVGKEGQKWGFLRVKSIESEAESLPKLGGGTYLTGRSGPTFYTLECGCGRSIVLEEKDFPGRRVMRCCGQGDCSEEALLVRKKAEREERIRVLKTNKDRGLKRTTELKTTMQIYMPVSLAERLDRWAAESNSTRSRAVAKLIESGLDLYAKRQPGEPSVDEDDD